MVAGPTRTAWSDMASTSDNRQKFINSLMDLFETHGLDGVDLDWEYPVAGKY
jgi:chitinase